MSEKEWYTSDEEFTKEADKRVKDLTKDWDKPVSSSEKDDLREMVLGEMVEEMPEEYRKKAISD